MNCWQRLAIEETTDLRAIKKAYAIQLKLIDQETEADAFIALREALQQAQFQAEYLDDSDHDHAESEDLEKQVDQKDSWFITTFSNTTPDSDQLTLSASDLNLAIENHYQTLQQQIENQDIHFNLRDALFQLKREIEQLDDIDQAEHIEKITTLLDKHGLEDFVHLVQISPNPPSIEDQATLENFDPNTLTHEPVHWNQADKADWEVEQIETSSQNSFSKQVDEVSQALWNGQLDDALFTQYQAILNQDHQLSLSQQFYIKDQLTAPLAEIESNVLDPQYQRFLALWQQVFPEDEQNYDEDYYSQQLQLKRIEYLTHDAIWKKIPIQAQPLIEYLSGVQKFQPFKMLKLQAALGKVLPDKNIIEFINQLQLNDIEYNTNYLFFKSLNQWGNTIWINILVTLHSLIFFHTTIGLNESLNLIIGLILALAYFVVIQAPIQAYITSSKNRELILLLYTVLWLFTGAGLVAFAPFLQPQTHAIFSYMWFISTLLLFCSVQSITPSNIKLIFQSVNIKSDVIVMSIGLIGISTIFAFAFFNVGGPNYYSMIDYSLIPIGFLLLSNSFSTLCKSSLKATAQSSHSFKNKVRIYTLFSLFILIIFSIFIYVLISESIPANYYLACLSLISIIFCILKMKVFSSCLKYISYLGLAIATSFTFVFPLVFIYLMYRTFRERTRHA